jgi:hypothetical protein
MIRFDANALVWFLVRDNEEKLEHARTIVCRVAQMGPVQRVLWGLMAGASSCDGA